MTALMCTAVVFSGLLSLMPEMGVEGVSVGRPAGTETLDGMADEGLPGKWLTDFEAAKQVALQQQVPLVVHFEATWCGPCRQMNASVLNQPGVLAQLRTGIVGVRIDADESPELISRFGVASLPTEIVFSPDGREIARHVGLATLETWVARASALSGIDASASHEPASDQAAIRSETAEEAATAQSRSESVADDETSTDPEKLRSCLIVRRDGNTVGLGGYSPVALMGQKVWEKGSAEFVAEYEGVEYFFRTAEERSMFRQSPEIYVPRLHGCDPVKLHRENRAEAGAIEYGAFYKGHLFFFASPENRRRFQTNPEWYAEIAAASDVHHTGQFPFLKTDSIE